MLLRIKQLRFGVPPMDDVIFIAIMLACLALTFGLVQMCEALMPSDTGSQTGSKP